jgi:hypothetical protein
MKIIPILLLGSIFFPPGEILNGKVVDVVDGNTIEILTDENEAYKIELAGVDSLNWSSPLAPRRETFGGKKVLRERK